MSGPRRPGRAAGVSSQDARDMLDRQTEILELVAGAAPLHEVLTRILTSLERLMPGARCSVLLLDRELGTLHHGAAPSLPEPYVTSIDGMAIGEQAGSCGTAAALDVAVVAVDVRTDPRWVDFRAAADAAGLRSCWSTPIDGRDGSPVGTFAVYHDRPHRPTAREQLLVDRFTHLAAVAIDHDRLLDELVQSEERFRRSFDDNALGMAVLGADRRVSACNPALTALAGRQLVGCALADVLVPHGQPLGARLDDLDGSGTGPLGFEAVLHRADGQGRDHVEVEVTVSLLDGRDGDAAQFVVNVLDLTERRAAERERRARVQAETARRTAEEASHAKSELLAAVGHEARTPIQAIVGFAELLGTMDLDEARRREALSRIGAAAGHVMDLLADVLDLARTEAGALPLAMEPVRVREVADEALGLLSATAQRRHVDLGHDLADDVVCADRRRLRQVLLNLLSNAVRYGGTGAHVRVRTSSGQEDEAVVLSVDDDGPGIPTELLPRLFTPFARAAGTGPGTGTGTGSGSGSGSGTDEGVGLGLGLAHGLVAAMGGELTVGSSTAAGTSMLLRLPRAEAPRDGP